MEEVGEPDPIAYPMEPVEEVYEVRALRAGEVDMLNWAGTFDCSMLYHFEQQKPFYNEE